MYTHSVPHVDNAQSSCPVSIRLLTEAVTTSPLQFLEMLGYRDEFDYIKEGTVYLHPRDVIVYVYAIGRQKDKGPDARGEKYIEKIPAFSNAVIVEAIATGSEVTQRQSIENVRSVAKQLAPIVVLRGVSQKELMDEIQRRG